MTAEYFETRFKKGRGMSQASLDLIKAMYDITKATNPIIGRGVGYKLFIAGLTPSMEKRVMQRVYRLLKEAREHGEIEWHWIVDENRQIERVSTWANPEEYADAVSWSYRRDFWNLQPIRIEVWSEKGTVRGVLAPVLDEFAVGFRVLHGFSGATTIHEVAEDDDRRPLIILYVGDYDPSGLFMSESDLPERLRKYGGNHVLLKRVALCREHLKGLPSFPVTDKRKDPRFRWFTSQFGKRCWELDAMDPNDLREIVRREIVAQIEPEAWAHCATIEQAEKQSLRKVLDSWNSA